MPGKLAHLEMPANDAARARGFGSSVFDRDFGEAARPAEARGGHVHRTAGEPGGPAACFGAADTDGNPFFLFESGTSAGA